MEYPTNIVLLLLQIVLEEQEKLAHRNKKFKLDDLLTEPLVDAVVLEKVVRHPLVHMYSPDIENTTLRGLKSIVRDIFDQGIDESSNTKNEDSTPVTLITLANYYYAKRIHELEGTLPNMKDQIQEKLAEIQ
ncbi:similar to Saccharomyces cerevisiae YLR385C SWC7 Protein of unknown function, component of the Swr1p complex that incorporates Htz1p into chromatin [Maudiozyma barnettii]|uniref:Uncharacterized protein n=1 Tax=Maudiozyma barnettii TaxID=61262 RepID=A0A8H2VKX9_9SACH|nr:Swc7p [Kazachstania barnettii]CAB4257266.1 similar to Saccharomyces cerevisiae YLR385C SWC7 Protein of unknown function, component of the Swr1p complex that incorporates Htz1p into chromatin [Kazachstania barnettii]CAD1784531.1 similar to Saccharomyces cerevisiae YLR385C SWC7 Protein of unknown function, component of the Swr1p complex that incorporates Htz1p into chromatin [Kazachstania barnettii]